VGDVEALNNREIAVLAWLAGVFLLSLTRASLRRSFAGVLHAALAPKIALTMAAFALYVAGMAWLGSRIGIWNLTLLKDTIIWFVVAGLTLFGGFVGVTGDRFFRRRLLATIAVPTVIEFYLGIVSFPLLVELVLQPFIVVLVVLSTVAAMNREHKPVEVAIRSLQAFIGLAILGWTAVQIALSWETLDKPHLVLTFYLPFWLTAAALVFVYGMGVLSTYEWAFMRVDFASRDQAARRRSKAALALGFHFRLRALSEFVRERVDDLVSAPSFGLARDIVRRHKQAG